MLGVEGGGGASKMHGGRVGGGGALYFARSSENTKFHALCHRAPHLQYFFFLMIIFQ